MNYYYRLRTVLGIENSIDLLTNREQLVNRFYYPIITFKEYIEPSKLEKITTTIKKILIEKKLNSTSLA